MEEKIKLAAKLYKCRDSAKSLYREKYPEKIQWYKDVIQNAQKKWKKDVLETTIDLCNLSSIKEEGVAIMMFMAAATELIEPSTPTTKNK